MKLLLLSLTSVWFCFTLITEINSTKENASLRKTLREFRLSKMMTVPQLSEATGLAVSSIVAIEHGAKPRLSTIKKLCSTLQCAPDEIEWPGTSFEQQVGDKYTYSATLRECLEKLSREKIYLVEHVGRRWRPENLIIGNDDEGAWLQALTVLEMKTVENPVEGERVGTLRLQYPSAFVTTPRGEELFLREEIMPVCYSSKDVAEPPLHG